jgi:hypothetical protein
LPYVAAQYRWFMLFTCQGYSVLIVPIGGVVVRMNVGSKR